MKLVDNAKDWWKMFSMQAQAFNLALLGSWQILPTKFQEILPVNALLVVAVVLLILGMVGRLVKQTNIESGSSQ
jgi:hypothetical protein